MSAFTPNIDCATLHGESRLESTAANATDSLVVEDVLDLVGCLLIRSLICVFYVSKAQTLHRAFSPRVDVSRTSNGHTMRVSCCDMNNLRLIGGLRQAEGHLRWLLDQLRDLFV